MTVKINWRFEWPDDVARIHACLRVAGFDVTPIEACALWRIASATWSAGWMMLDGYTDAGIVEFVKKACSPMRDELAWPEIWEPDR